MNEQNSMYSPDRITLRPDGNSYCWSCEIDKEYERRAYRITMIFCGSLAAFLLVYGLVLSLMFHNLKSFGIVLLCVGGFLLISFGICLFLDSLPGQLRENYIMTQEYIQSGSGRSRSLIEYKKIKNLRLTPKYIGVIKFRIEVRFYVPPEDRDFIWNFILNRATNAEVKYG